MKKVSLGQIIAIAAAFLVLVCFFFPWVEFNLLLATANISGFQLASGNGPGGAGFAGMPSLWLIPLSMIGVLVIVGICFAGQATASSLKSIGAVIVIGAGALSVLVILYQYFNLNQELNQNVLGMIVQKTFSYSFGAHGALLGSAVVAGGGLIDLVTGRAKTTQ
jgi:hypothetical protein